MDLRSKVLVVASLVLLAMWPLLGSRVANVEATGPVASFPQQPMTKNPYVTTFSLTNYTNTIPFVLSPSPLDSKTVWVVAIHIGKPLFSLIINFTTTLEPMPLVVLNLTNVEAPSIVADNKGRVWFPLNDSLAFYDTIARKLQIAATYPGDYVQYIAVDSTNRVWTTLSGPDQLAMYDPSDPSNGRTFRIPGSEVFLQGIAVAPDGGIWFTDPGQEKLGRLDPTTLGIREYASPVRLLAPIQLTVAPDGVVWFTDHGTNEFGSFNPLTGEWTKIPVGYCSGICSATLPNAIEFDPAKDVLWFSEHFAGRIARYDPGSGLLTEYTVPVPAGSPSTTFAYTWWAWPGLNNLVWFTSFGLGEIGYVNASIPVPLTLSTIDKLTLQRGSSAQFTVQAISSSEDQVAFGITESSLDENSGNPTISGSFISNALVSITPYPLPLRIQAAWSASLGTHYVSVTVLNGELAVSRHVALTVTENLAPYATQSLDLALVSATSIIYIRHRLRRPTPSTNLGQRWDHRGPKMVEVDVRMDSYSLPIPFRPQKQ